MSAGDMHARDLMSPGGHTISGDQPLNEAARLMCDLGVGALPIVGEDGRLEGIITDRDIVVKCVAENRDPATVTAGELALGLISVTADTTASDALELMEQHQIRRLPVVEGGRIVGMISEADLARCLSDDDLVEFVHQVYARG